MLMKNSKKRIKNILTKAEKLILFIGMKRRSLNEAGAGLVKAKS